MAINVAHEPDPRLVAEAAFQTGRGQGYLRERDYADKRNQEAYSRYLEEWNRRKQLEQERYNRALTERAYGTAQEQQDYERSKYAEEQAFERPFKMAEQERQFAQTDALSGYYESITDNQAERASQLEEQKRQEMAAKYNAEWQFTDEQKREQSKLQQQMQSVQMNPSLSEQQRQYAFEQLQAQLDAIQPQMVPRQTDMQAQMQTELVETPAGYMGKKADGSWYLIDIKKTEFDEKKQAAQLEAKLQDLALKQASKEAETAAMVDAGPVDIGARYAEIYDSLKQATSGNRQQDVSEPDSMVPQNVDEQQPEDQLIQLYLAWRQATDPQEKQMLAIQYKQARSNAVAP